MATLREKIEVMQAAERGEEIEACDVDGNGEWFKEELTWDWVQYDYRVKPKPREIWVNEYDDVLASYCDEDRDAVEAKRRPRTAVVRFVEAERIIIT